MRQRSVHARVAAFCALPPDGPAAILGAIGNVGPFWKVAGKDAGRDARGELTGTAFVDLRVTLMGDKGV